MAGNAQQITAWSLSRLQTYEECPFKAYCSYILKMPYTKGPAQIRGDAIHKMAEAFLKGEARALKPELKNYEVEFKRCKSAGKDPEAELLVEQQWGLNNQWKPTGWFGSDTWCRVISDMVIVHDGHVKMVDHKTGKPYEKHVEQLELYAIAAFNRFPEAETANGEIWYLDHKQADVPPLNMEFDRSQLAKLEVRWAKRAKPMLADKKFAPRPGPQCRWCSYKKSDGGPCKY